MRKWFIRFIKAAVAVIVLLAVSGYLLSYFVFSNRGSSVPSLNDCPKGSLATVHSCQQDQSKTSFQNSGWYYFSAEGIPSATFCEGSSKKNWPETVPFPVHNDKVEKFQKVSCAETVGSSFAHCYAFDRPATNGNTHYYLYIASDKDCSRGLYFSGSRRRLEKGKIIEPSSQ